MLYWKNLTLTLKHVKSHSPISNIYCVQKYLGDFFSLLS